MFDSNEGTPLDLRRSRAGIRVVPGLPSSEDAYVRGVLSPDRMSRPEVKNVTATAEVKKFEHAKIELVDVAGGTVARFTLQKGWKWSNDIKPIVKTEWCEAPHLQYIISGRYRVKMKDGTEFDIGPGDVASVPAGHDAWVVGDEPAMGIEFVGGRVAAEGPKTP